MNQKQRFLMQAALKAVDEGMAVIPLKINSGGLPGGPELLARATRDPAVVREWWGVGPFNVAIVTGEPSSLLVVNVRPPHQLGLSHGVQELADLARAAGAEVPANTRVIQTPFGGYHLYFRLPDGLSLPSSEGELGANVDVHAAGDYTVGPGSIVGGRRYKVFNPAAPQPPPDWLVEHLQALPDNGSRPPRDASARHLVDSVHAVVRHQAARVAAAEPADVRHTLFGAGRRLGRLVAAKLLDAGAARHALTDAAGHLDPAVVNAILQTAFERANRDHNRAVTPLVDGLRPRRDQPRGHAP